MLLEEGSYGKRQVASTGGGSGRRRDGVRTAKLQVGCTGGIMLGPLQKHLEVSKIS